MELIKRKIKQPTTTGLTQGYWNADLNIPNITTETETGYMWYVEVSGNTLIIPDLASGYSTNILLSANVDDWGFFDVLEEDEAVVTGTITCDALSAVTSGTSVCDTGSTFPSGVTLSAGTYTVSGVTSSRLSEVRKFSKTGSTLSQLYFIHTGGTENGLILSGTTTGLTASTYIYYLSGITYTDEIVSGETTSYFRFVSSGYSSPVFVNLPYVKDERRQNIISSPIVSSDVFIVRDSKSAFQNNYRLRDIGNLTELTYYAGGAYFNIVENT